MDIRNEFPALQGSTYLNTAASGILYNSLYQWRRDHDQAYYEQGSDFRMYQMQFLEGVKDSVAAFFSADRQHTYLTANFSSGYGVLLDGLPANYRFLLLGHEFPAVYYQVQSRGFENEMVPLGADLEQRIVERITAFRPQVFAFSLVQYSNGLKLSQAFWRSLKEQFPELILIADGTQYLGTEQMDFSHAPFDALLGSCYKWMLGGYGCGVALLKDSLAQQLYTDAQSRALPSEAFLKHKTSLALRFEPGHQDTFAFGSLQHSIHFLNGIGAAKIAEKIKEHAAKAKAAFSNRGLLEDYIVAREEHSSIFRLNISNDTIARLQKANITGTSRGDGFRVSFHIYNNEADLEHLLNVLDQ